MLVTNKFQASLYRNGLPSDFEVVKVDLESLKDSTLRRLLRDLEKQLELEQAKLLDTDRESSEEYLVKILSDQLFDTKDIKSDRTKTLIVLGDKSGMLSGRVFNSSNWEKSVVDHNQFSDKYPIFIDSSVIKFAEKGSEKLKRERDETFTFAPEQKKEKVETVNDLQAIWYDQEREFMAQIDDLKTKYNGAMEQNQQLMEAAQTNENALLTRVNTLVSKVRDLEVSRMEVDQAEQAHAEELATLRDVNEQLRQEVEANSQRVSEPSTQTPKIMGMFDSFMKFAEEGKIDELEDMVSIIENDNKFKISKLTLAQFGLSPWNPSTCNFLEYVYSFRVAMSARQYDAKTIQLLFSALPSKYSYIRPLLATQNGYDPNNYIDVEFEIVNLIVGGREKIFSEFLSLQKRNSENYIQFFQKLCDFYFYGQTIDRDEMKTDPTTFQLIKDKLCKAYPNKYLPEFKRRLEGKKNLGDILDAIIGMRENFPDSENNRDSDMEINVLRSKNKDWQKNAKCYRCGRTGHIKRDCYAKREAKDKKSGNSSRRKR